VRCDRAAGYPSRSVVLEVRPKQQPIVGETDFDVVLSAREVPWQNLHWLGLIDLLRHGDIWNALFDCLFFRPDQRLANSIAFRLLRWTGIRIVVSPHGCDVVHRIRYQSRFDWVGQLQLDYPGWGLDREQVLAARNRIDLFCRSADLVIGADASLAPFLPRVDLLFKQFPVAITSVAERRRLPNSPLIVLHATNHRHVKGTKFLERAIEELRRRGLVAHLTIVEKVPKADAIALYRQADIIADQFIIGSFGAFALEGMALGKPVLTYLDERHLGDPMFNHPLVNANPENLEAVLSVLLQVPRLRDRLGAAGRDSVVRYQSVEALAEVWDRIYRHVWWREPLRLEGTRHFDRRREARSFTEDPGREEFWPVPAEDLMGEVHEALSNAGFGARSPVHSTPRVASGRL
jgi:glycosyltransferase involved in cell wall biosynthesis